MWAVRQRRSTPRSLKRRAESRTTEDSMLSRGSWGVCCDFFLLPSRQAPHSCCFTKGQWRSRPCRCGWVLFVAGQVDHSAGHWRPRERNLRFLSLEPFLPLGAGVLRARLMDATILPVLASTTRMFCCNLREYGWTLCHRRFPLAVVEGATGKVLGDIPNTPGVHWRRHRLPRLVTGSRRTAATRPSPCSI